VHAKGAAEPPSSPWELRQHSVPSGRSPPDDGVAAVAVPMDVEMWVRESSGLLE
jgi:hypothetical protein